MFFDDVYCYYCVKCKCIFYFAVTKENFKCPYCLIFKRVEQ